MKDMGEDFQRRVQPIQVAACQVADGHVDAAVQTLICNGEPLLAYLVCRILQSTPPNALFEVATESCVRIGSLDVAVALAGMVRGGAIAVEHACVACKDGQESFYAKAGLRAPASFAEAGTKAKDASQWDEAVRCFVLAGDATQACDAALQVMHATAGSASWEYGPVQQIIKRLGAVSLENVESTIRNQVLAYSAFFGLIEALWRGYCPILYGLSQMLERLQPSLPATQRDIIQGIVAKLNPQRMFASRAGIHTTDDQLPTAAHKPGTLSAASGQGLTGSTVLLEADMVMSRSEALMWQTVNPFSPAGSGKRLIG